MHQRLYRHSDDRMVAGVCAGLGEYCDIDPTLVRVAFVLLACISGIGIVTYVILALLMPRQDDMTAPASDRARHGVNDLGEGAQRMAVHARSAMQDTQEAYGGIGQRFTAQMIIGAIFVVVGSILLMSNFVDLWLLGWKFVWPLLIVVVGVFILFRTQR